MSCTCCLPYPALLVYTANLARVTDRTRAQCHGLLLLSDKKMTTQDRYSLGAGENEQARLLAQRELYGDTRDLQFSASDSVCEFGCGVGANLWIAEAVTQGNYVGLDFLESQITSARQVAKDRGLTNTEFIVRDAAATGLESDCFDASFCRCVLIHQADPLPIVQEMVRVTKPGGRLILIEPHDVSYYVGPNKTHLLKAFRARNEKAYGAGKGSPEVAVNLYSILCAASLKEISLRPHVIQVCSTETERFTAFLNNLLGLIRPTAEQLVQLGMLTAEDWQLAQEEAEVVDEDSFLTQSLWIAEAYVP